MDMSTLIDFIGNTPLVELRQINPIKKRPFDG